jgi:hypothetical protein
VLAQQLTSTGYASAWALTHFLGQRRQADFFEYMKEVSALGPFERMAPAENEQAFFKHFGEDYGALETAMVKHLQSLPYVDPFPTRTPAATAKTTTTVIIRKPTRRTTTRRSR